jgi:DNA-binding XRE family transcriptional regulator
MFALLTLTSNVGRSRRVRVPQIYKTLGQSITVLRRKSEITQQQLADAIGVSRASIANIERGEQRVFLDQAVALTTFFELSGIDALVAAAHQNEAVVGARINLSGDRLNRIQKREVNDLLDQLLTEDQ